MNVDGQAERIIIEQVSDDRNFATMYTPESTKATVFTMDSSNSHPAQVSSRYDPTRTNTVSTAALLGFRPLRLTFQWLVLSEFVCPNSPLWCASSQLPVDLINKDRCGIVQPTRVSIMLSARDEWSQ